MSNTITRLIGTGSKQSYFAWETHLTRKLNSISLVGIFNMLVAIVFFQITGYTEFMLEHILAAIVLPFVLLLNKQKNYIWASYWFYIWGFIYFVSVNIKMGKDSLVFLFYFPVIISMIQILGRRETIKHLVVLSVLCLLSILATNTNSELFKCGVISFITRFNSEAVISCTSNR